MRTESWLPQQTNEAPELVIVAMTRARDTFRTGDQALVRQINLSLIMNVLHQHAPISRAALAHMTGLNKTTVSDLVAELIGAAFIREAGPTSSGTGRPGTLLMLNPAAGCLISCEVGVDGITVLLSDFTPTPLWRSRVPVAPEVEQATRLTLLTELLHTAVCHSRSTGSPLLGIAVAVPGIVEQPSGTVRYAPNLVWQHVPLKTLLEREAFGAPVIVDNDGNMAALGEHYFGAGRGATDMLYITIGVGLGGGVIRNGQLNRGVSGGAAEFGHMTVDPFGQRCACGNRGCLETHVSQRALLDQLRAELTQGAASVLQDWTGGDARRLTLDHVLAAAAQADPLALTALTTLGRWLGVGVASLVNVYNPALVIIGGVLDPVAAMLLPIIEAELDERTLPCNRDAVRVVRAAHGADANIQGGLAAISQQVLGQPLTRDPLKGGAALRNHAVIG